MITKEKSKSDRAPDHRRAPTVVIVDDQPEVLVSLRRVFRDERFDLATFSSPAEALEWMGKHPVDLIIADERMPEMRGSDLLETIRGRSPSTIRVILTGYPGSATVGYGLSHGVDWLISKPWNDDALRLTLRQLLEERDPGRPGALGPIEATDLADFCEKAPVALQWVGADGVIRWANRADLEVLGYSREELFGRRLAEIHADEAALQDLLQKLARRERVRGHAARLRCKNGSVVEVIIDADPQPEGSRTAYSRLSTRLAPEPDPAGPVPSSEQTLEQELRQRKKDLDEINRELVTEVAQKNRAEETRRLTEIRFGLLVESVKDYAILMLTPDGIVVSWNIGAERLNGYAAEEILGRHFSVFYVPEDIAAGKPGHLLEKAAREGHAEDEGWRVRKDGSRLWSNVVITALHDSSDRLIGFSKVTRDMSERRKAEEERHRLQASMLQGQKLQAIGQLSAGIAHEINNPVGYILSNLNTMGEYCQDLRRLADAAGAAARAWEEKRDPSEALASYVRLAVEVHADQVLSDLSDIVSDCKLGGEKIRDIVRSLREFSHVDPSELQPTDLNTCLENSLRICWNELKYKAKVHKQYGALPPVPCYAQRLGQVFVNLLVNAAQAIEKKGEIRLFTGVEDGQAVIRIHDSGRGIAPEHLGKIFEPFFTTKSIGEGTGLGLHVAYKIVTAHRGTIGVTSELGKGTEFTVRLPLEGPRSAAAAENRRSS
ncbi:MAG TPA: PAS domain S-box protein [Planctomycetota bacterium]|nr:PAS domain S-box protein [Planctomycetota bacterium]